MKKKVSGRLSVTVSLVFGFGVLLLAAAAALAVPDAPCNDDRGCDCREYCRRGVCTFPEPPECRTDQDCGVMSICSSCRTCLSVECQADSDCSQPALCRDNECVEVECTRDIDCRADMRCNVERFSCVPRCDSGELFVRTTFGFPECTSCLPVTAEIFFAESLTDCPLDKVYAQSPGTEQGFCIENCRGRRIEMPDLKPSPKPFLKGK